MLACGCTRRGKIPVDRLTARRSRPAAATPTLARRLASPLLLALLVSGLGGCGKSQEQQEEERIAREAAIERAAAVSLAEEREKDRRMREGAAAQVSERLARQAAEHEQELERAALMRSAPTQEQQDAQRAETVRAFSEKLRESTADPGSVQLRGAELSPKLNALCVEFNAKSKAGVYAGFKRAVVTDVRIAVEEPPMRDTMTQFLLFQIAARDSGCFPDVQRVQIVP